ncbi:MAG: chromate transporter [Bacteroidaceae bacterium]|nr:chromate transporter [Bacteroidaceae bacterium]
MNWTLFSTFVRIGLFTIGGGYAMIPLIESEVTAKHNWVDKEELIDLIAVAQSCPGIFAINISIFIGYKLRGVPGAALCALGTALPSFLIILAIALCFQQFRDNVWVDRAFRGIRPAVVALILAPVFKMAKGAKISRYNCWIPIVAAAAIWLLGVSPILVIILAGVGGYLYGRFKSGEL